MNCYVHNETHAIGACVDCGKAVCEHCHMESKGKIYCKACMMNRIESLERENEYLEIKTQKRQSMKRDRVNQMRIIAALLAIFAGTFGAHKFYLGEKQIGLFYVAFWWTGVTAIIGFIEGITYFLSDDKSFERRHLSKKLTPTHRIK